jgi:structure-specific endonuclease subunit SLX1
VGLKDRLANLNLLLHVPSFARWPLKVRFFAEDVYSAWREKAASEDSSVEAILDFPIEGTADAPAEQTAAEKDPPKRKRRKKAVGSELPANVKVVHEGGIPALDVSYKRFRPILEKGRFVLAEGETVRCAVCSERIRDEEFPVTLLCLKDGCHAASHLGCLSQHFLAQEKPGSDRQPKAMIPSEGKCPSCGEVAEWVDLITALSLRMRDPKMVNQILEKRKGNKRKDPSLGHDWREHLVVPDSEEDLAAEPDGDNLSEAEEFDFEDEEPGVDADDADEALRPEDVVDEPLLREVDDEADASSVASSDGARPARSRPKPRPVFRMPPELTVTIEDSEDEPGR